MSDPLGPPFDAERHDRVLGPWQAFCGRSRSSAYHLIRHGALKAPAYRAVLAAPAAGRTGLELARRGRAWRLLGEPARAAAEFRGAVALEPTLAAAHAWAWEAGSGPGGRDGSLAGIERAISLEPRRGAWRVLKAVTLASRRRAAARDLESLLRDVDRGLEDGGPAELAWGARGFALERLGRPREAALSLDRAVASDPGRSWMLAYRGELLLGLGRREEALADLEAAVLTDEACGYFAAFLEGGKEASPRARAEAAGSYLRAHPRAYWMHAFRADCRRSEQVNDLSGGLSDLERAVELKPDCSWAWAYLSRARFAAGQGLPALEAVSRAVALAPACGWVRSWRGELRRKLGDLPGALADLDRGVALDADYEYGYAWRGGVLRRLARVEDSLADLDLACRLEPGYAWALHERSLALRALGRGEEALRDLEAAHRLDSKFVWCADPGRAEGDLRVLDRIVRRRARDPLARLWRAQVRRVGGDRAGARRDLERAVRLAPASGRARARRAQMLAEEGDMPRADREFTRSLAGGPGDAWVLAWRGRTRWLQGRLRDARADLARACRLEGRAAWMAAWKGELELLLGAPRAAVRDLTVALELDAGYREALLARALAFERLRDPAAASRDRERARLLGAPSRSGIL